MSAKGTIEIDFSTGSNEASVAVTGQTAITSSNAAEAWIMREASTEHTANDHAYAALFMALTCNTPTDGVGFTIYATTTEKLSGKFSLRWVWA